MKKILVVLSAFILLLGLSGAAGAYSITKTYLTDAGLNNYISPYAGVAGYITEDFEGTLAWTWTGNGSVRQGAFSGVAAPPDGASTPDSSKYMSVPENAGNSPLSISVTNLGGVYNYFGLWWGSVDDYNKIDFYNDADLVGTVSGLQIYAPPIVGPDNQIGKNTNLYVNISGLLPYDSFTITSTRYAFEMDNVTIGVPEPTTMLLLGLGLLGVAGIRRKFKK